MKEKIQGIQMIGTQRSGSNLLRVMLDAVDQITAPHPPHILQRFIPLLDKYGDLNQPEHSGSMGRCTYRNGRNHGFMLPVNLV